MSGSRRNISIAADADGVIARLVRAAARLGDAYDSPWALVGGLAVMVQVAEAHRATADVDIVADDDAGHLEAVLATLNATTASPTRPNGVLLDDGTSIDVITTGGWIADDLPDDDLDRVFILGHWWAVRTAEAVDLQVADGTTTQVTAALAVARPAALIACKLQSCQRRQRAEAKASSDIYDIYRLLVEYDRGGDVAAGMACGPEDLGAWCADALTEILVTNAARSARRLGVSARGPAMADVTALDLEVVGSLCAEAIRDGLD